MSTFKLFALVAIVLHSVNGYVYDPDKFEEVKPFDFNAAQKETCFARLKVIINREKLFQEQAFDDLSIVLHRNGQVGSCGTQSLSYDRFMEELEKHYDSISSLVVGCPSTFNTNKYVFENMLTTIFQNMFAETCHSEEFDRAKSIGFMGYCDLGPARTPDKLENQKLVPLASKDGEQFLPCHYHSRSGVRLNLEKFTDFARNATCGDKEEDCETREFHVYAVPAARHYMFAPESVGEIFDLPHVEGANPDEPVYMEVLSLDPRVFEIKNFFSVEDSHDFISRALNADKMEALERSSTGFGSIGGINNKRTSDK
jgi:hypothetical protein